MSYFKLLPLSLVLLTAFNHSAYAAEQLRLPSMSVEGSAGEETPYALPPITLSTPDTGDMIKRLPGANINSNGPLTSVVQYRGLFGDRVNVLIDGVRISQAGPNRMDSPLSYLPSSRVADVALYRGIAPVSSGIETIGGTIIANSKKAEFGADDEAEFHGNTVAGYADNGNTRYAGLLASVANDTHRFQVAGSADRGNDLDFGGGTIRPSRQERDTIGITYGFQKLGHELELDIEQHDTGKTGTAALPMDIMYAKGENYKTKFSKSLNNGGKINARLNYQDAEHLMSNYVLRTNPVMVNMGGAAMKRYADSDVQSQGYHIDYAKSDWTVGFDGDQAEHNATIYNPDMGAFFIDNYNDVERDRYSVFAQWNKQLNESWNTELGARYSLIQMDAGRVNSNMNPMNMGGMMAMMQSNVNILQTEFNNSDRSQNENLVDLTATFTHKIDEDLDLNFGLARKERAPSYQERYLWLPMESTSGLADGNNYMGNVNLDKETAYQGELGFDWHTQKAAFSPHIFYHHVNNYIQGTLYNSNATVNAINHMMATSAVDRTILQFNNVDAKLYGIDANWFVAMTNTWQLDGTVSYVRGERRDTADNLYRIAPLTARTMLSYVKTTWRVGVEAETVAAQNKVSSENNEQKTSGYALFNLMGNYQATEALTVSAGINNLFDRDYQNHLGGYNRISDNPDIAQGDRLPGLGRSVYAGVNFNW
ncbi:MAG: TonB-dependent receptor [Pseudomonadota bacterium]|nr:TonB-dependent receptor [Pseudomonadota bacterium]